jgi:ADP-heptose:LPS heptosyltransferase
LKTLKARRGEFEVEVALNNNGYKVQFRNHLATVRDEVADILLAQRPDFYTLVAASQPIKDEKLLIVRDTGIGDLLLLTPVLSKLKANGNIIDFVTETRNFGVLQGNPSIRQLLPLERFSGRSDGYDKFVDLRMVSERAEAHGYRGHRINAFAEAFDLHIPEEDFKLDLVLTPEEIKWGRDEVAKFKRSSKCKKVIAFTWTASHHLRNLTEQRKLDIIKGLVAKGFGVIILHHSPPTTDFGNEPKILSMCGLTTIREMASLINACPLGIHPDTGNLHISLALNKPVVAYMGAFPASSRLSGKSARVVLNEYGLCSISPCVRYSCINKCGDGTVKCLDIPTSRFIDAIESLLP